MVSRRDRTTGRWVTGDRVMNLQSPGHDVGAVECADIDQSGVLSIDGTCRICRTGGALACHLFSSITIRPDDPAVREGPGVVFTRGEQQFVGFAAIIALLDASGRAGSQLSRFLTRRRVHPLGLRVYRWIVDHRHWFG